MNNTTIATIMLSIAVIVLSSQTVYAQEAPDVSPDPDFCYAVVETTQWTYQCVWSYQLSSPVNEEITQNKIGQVEDESTTEFFIQLQELIKAHTLEQKTTEKSQPDLPDRHEQVKREQEAKQAQLYEDALRCNYGEGGGALFVEQRETFILKQMEYFKHLPVAKQERELIQRTEECRVWKDYPFSGYNNQRYVDIASAQVPKAPLEFPVLGDTKKPKAVTSSDLARQAEKAREAQLALQWYNDPYGELTGQNRGGQGEGRECGDIPPKMTTEGRITKSGKIACPEKEANTYKSAIEILTQADYEKRMCEIAWKNSAQYGDRSPVWWREMLKDGSCDEHIPEIADIRAEKGFVYKLWKHQNADNCPDCGVTSNE